MTGSAESYRSAEGIARISAADFFRMSARLDAFNAAISFAPIVSPTASVGVVRPSMEPPIAGANDPPLSPMTRWKSPFASGDDIRKLALLDPADCPKIVTL